MIYPSSINKGDIIKIISPSNGIKESKLIKLDKAINNLNKYGFKVIEDNYTRFSNYGVSTSKENRILELNNSFSDDSKALIAVSGGDFINEIMPKLKFKNYLYNIKWIQGHSDITILLYYLTTNYDVATIYNFNVTGYTNKNIITDNAILALENKLNKQYSYNWKCLKDFDLIEGRIIGGCLESLKDIIGTKFDAFKKFAKKYRNDGIIWYFDISQFSVEDISRTMWQFKNMGYFKYCKAILFSKIEEISYTGLSLEQVLNNELQELNIPIIMNGNFGHNINAFTIVNGAIFKIKKINNNYEMDFKLQK